MPARRLALAVLFLAPTYAGIARAQAVTGLSDDATTPPAATFRVRIESGWTYWDKAFVSDGNGNGRLQPLGERFTLDSLGAAQLPALAPVRDSIRSLSGLSAFNLSVGGTSAQITERINAIPIGVEAGITSWLSVAATVPIVRTRSNVFFRANATGTQGNVGFQDAATLAADTAFAGQMIRSANAAQAYCAGAGAASGSCAGYAAQVASARSFGNAAAAVYRGTVVPIQGSAVQTAINTRGAALRAYLNALANSAGSGVPAITSAGLTGSTAPFATQDVQALIATTTGLGALGTVTHTGLGDVEALAKMKLFDTFANGAGGRFAPTGLNARFAVAAGYRLPTGKSGSPDILFDIPTGTHAGAVLLRAYADVGIGSHLWASFVGRMARSRSDSVILRATESSLFPDATSRLTVSRQLGDAVEIEATPRWAFNDFLSIGAQYVYRRRAADTYSDAAGTMLVGYGPGTDFTEQRVGGGIVFSNGHAVAIGRSHVPFDVSYLHLETIAGSGGAPKLISDQIMARFYYRPHIF